MSHDKNAIFAVTRSGVGRWPRPRYCRVAAVLQHRLHLTMSRGRWYCRCYCCCCCRCYCHATTSCRCSSGPPADTRYLDQRGGWVHAPLSPQISPADPAADASFLAVLAADATGAAVPPVNGVSSASTSDDTAPVDDSRPPTAPLVDAAEGTVPLVAGSAGDISSDAAATADDAGAPPTDVADGTVPPVAGAVVNANLASAEAGALAAPPHRRSGENSTAGRWRCYRYRRRCRAR